MTTRFLTSVQHGPLMHYDLAKYDGQTLYISSFLKSVAWVAEVIGARGLNGKSFDVSRPNTSLR
jgi:hypothetical protein